MIPKCIMDENLKKLSWDDYIGNRSHAFHPSGFHIIVPNDCQPSVPLYCPVCDCVLSTGEDVTSCRNHGCCDHCKEKWYYSNKEKWENGWRPKIDVSCNHKKTVLIDVTNT